MIKRKHKRTRQSSKKNNINSGYCQDASGIYYNYCDGGTVRDYYCGGTWDSKSWESVKCSAGGYSYTSSGLQCANGQCVKI